jgi:hypothetical protein
MAGGGMTKQEQKELQERNEHLETQVMILSDEVTIARELIAELSVANRRQERAIRAMQAARAQEE